MKPLKLLTAILCAAMLSGCDEIEQSVSTFIENDANIGKNAPAVVGTIADIEQLNEEAAESEAQKLTPEERSAIAVSERMEKQKVRAAEILGTMSTEDKLGQVILARCPKEPVENMEQYHLGGYTLYGEDFRYADTESVQLLTSGISAANPVAPFIAVDEEGGTVVRISGYSQFRDEAFSSPQVLYQRGGTELIVLEEEEKARLLKSLGINFNLAPVADISSDTSSYIYPRTMGQDAEGTAECVSLIVKTDNRFRLCSCLKHFPGYGDNTDTHSGAAHDPREQYEFYNRDFAVFEAGINTDKELVPAVMVGHTVYDMIDPDHPASLSPVIHEILRDRLAFDGVVVTDDLGMDAVKEYAGEESVYVSALLAGNDLLCVTDFETAYNDLREARIDGVITEDMLDEHVTRILLMKLRYGIIY